MDLRRGKGWITAEKGNNLCLISHPSRLGNWIPASWSVVAAVVLPLGTWDRVIRDFDEPLFNLFFHRGVRSPFLFTEFSLNVQRAWNSSHAGQETVLRSTWSPWAPWESPVGRDDRRVNIGTEMLSRCIWSVESGESLTEPSCGWFGNFGAFSLLNWIST